MVTNIEVGLNVLYQRQLTSREQLLKEMLRVKMTLHKLEENINIHLDKENLFQLMKKTTEEELGFFPADRDDFYDIFEALKEIDLISFTLEIYKNDRMGLLISPVYLTFRYYGNGDSVITCEQAGGNHSPVPGRIKSVQGNHPKGGKPLVKHKRRHL